MSNQVSLTPTAQALMQTADELAAVMSRIYHQSRFNHDGVDIATIGKLQELQRAIDKYSTDEPCVRAITAWESHLAAALVALGRERYAPAACEAFWHEGLRLQAEFHSTIESSQ